MGKTLVSVTFYKHYLKEHIAHGSANPAHALTGYRHDHCTVEMSVQSAK